MSRGVTKQCPLCDADPVRVSQHPRRDAFDIECRRCGPFTVSGTLYAISKIPPELKSQLSAYTRQCKENGQHPEMFSTYNLESIAKRVGTIPPDKKPDRLLAVAAKRSDHPGAAAPFSPEWDYPLIQGKNPQEAIYHRQALVNDGYIILSPGDMVTITHKGWKRLESQSSTPTSSSGQPDKPSNNFKEWDVFICHASEDKEAVVEPLVEALKARDLRVWYDRTILTIGDSLRRKIDEGLAKSRFGIVVLSRAFFGKGWPERELDGLVQKEIAGQKVILPVWHGVTHEEVARYSLPLADRLAGSTGQGIEPLADELLEAIKIEVTSVQEHTTAKTSPSAAAAPARSPQPEEKWVDIHYPRDSGLLRRLEAEGYRAKWCFDRDVARAIDIDGWELVYVDSGDGQRAILRLRDRPDNQTLLKKRPR